MNRQLSRFGMWDLVVLSLAFVLLIASFACNGSARHLATQADAVYSQAVFALDDAQWTACHPQPIGLSAAQCAALDPVVKKALTDVKAVTAALQATPKNGPVPTSLPSLLADLSDAGKVIDALGAGPTFATLSSKLHNANDAVIALLRQIAGGQ